MAERPLWTVDELISATGGKLHGTVSKALNGVAIDSRNLAPGDIFVAIKGDVHDGHNFVADALRTGAGIAIVTRATDEMKLAGPVLEINDDPLRALESMGRAARARSHARIIAVTGSVGKTSTKEMLKVALSGSGDTHVSAASFNNHWGVPLTLARLHPRAAFAVFEIGMNHAGEITPLVAMVQPHVAIITEIAASHLGHFTSLDDIAKAKAEIFTGVTPAGAVLINQDSPYFSFLQREARAAGIAAVHGFGKSEQADILLQQVALKPDCSCIAARVFGANLAYRLGLPGEHMVRNSLAVLGAVKLVGADLARAALALADAKPAKGRGVRQSLQAGSGEILLLDESYNANPASVRASLALLAQLKPGRGGRRLAVLGDMLELGDFGAQLHADLAADLEAYNIDLLFAAGPLMAHLWNLTPMANRGAYAQSSAELAPLLLEQLRSGDVVMIKGSLGSKMGPLAAQVRDRYPPLQRES